MGRILKLSILILLTFTLSGCPLKDWIKSDEDEVSVEEFKRITRVTGENDQSYQQHIDQKLMETKILRLFNLIAQYHDANEIEQKVLFKKIDRDFKQNPTLFNALFLSMIQVTINPNKKNLAVNSNLMKAIDMQSADPSLLELLNLFKSMESIKAKNKRLSNTIKLYRVENSKHKKNVAALKDQINALKVIEESIYERELVLDIQE